MHSPLFFHVYINHTHPQWLIYDTDPGIQCDLNKYCCVTYKHYSSYNEYNKCSSLMFPYKMSSTCSPDIFRMYNWEYI